MINMTLQGQRAPNKALQLTANPLRGLSAAELGRYAARLTPCELEG